MAIFWLQKKRMLSLPGYTGNRYTVAGITHMTKVPGLSSLIIPTEKGTAPNSLSILPNHFDHLCLFLDYYCGCKNELFRRCTRKLRTMPKKYTLCDMLENVGGFIEEYCFY